MRTRETNKGRRRLLAGIATVGLTLGGSAAYAFWSGGGEVGGTALVGSQGGGFVEVRQVGQPTGLTPGGPPGNIRIQITNPDANENSFVYLRRVIVQVDPDFSLDHDGDPDTPPCTAADFTTTDANYNGNLFGTGSATITATITMVDKDPTGEFVGDPATDPNNQDACKGASVDLILTPDYTPLA